MGVRGCECVSPCSVLSSLEGSFPARLACPFSGGFTRLMLRTEAVDGTEWCGRCAASPSACDRGEQGGRGSRNTHTSHARWDGRSRERGWDTRRAVSGAFCTGRLTGALLAAFWRLVKDERAAEGEALSLRCRPGWAL